MEISGKKCGCQDKYISFNVYLIVQGGPLKIRKYPLYYSNAQPIVKLHGRLRCHMN